MILQVRDTIKGETSLIAVKVCEMTDDALELFVWDTSGDQAIITVSVPSAIRACVDELWSNGKAVITGSLEWVDDDEDFE